MRNTIVLVVLFVCLALPGGVSGRTLVDGMGRTVSVPDSVDRVICSGPGCLRLLTYLRAQGLAVAVDDIEKRRRQFDARPYALANPQFKDMPLFGEFRGHDNPELIVALDPQPQVIFKTLTSGIGYDPDELQEKTGIPVVVLDYGDLDRRRGDFFLSLELMGEVLDRTVRAREVIDFFERCIADLGGRTVDVPEAERPTVFLGGVAFRGPHGFQSTEPAYPPFSFVNARAPAREGRTGKDLAHSDVAKEKILEWDPDVLFLDLSSLQLGEDGGGLHELRTDAAYRTLGAVREGRVYGLLPYNWYTKNYGSIVANAYFVGKLLYPERFADVEPEAMADSIYEFLVGEPVFGKMNALFSNLAYRRIPLD